MYTFKDTYDEAVLVASNERYDHYFTKDQLIKYYANFFEYKLNPNLDTFKEDEATQLEERNQHNQKHMLFIFPEQVEIEEAVKTYAESKGYEVNRMELYLQKGDALKFKASDEVEIIQVDEENIQDFLNICYTADVEHGKDFADFKREIHKRHVGQPHLKQLLAYIDGKCAGKLELIINKDTVELDDFYVYDNYRGRGIGSALQQHVVDQYPDTALLLIADGNDSPREMYMRQGYELISWRYDLLKQWDNEQ